MAFPQSIQEFWDAAIKRGLFPLAIARGTKAPIGAGWNVWTLPIPHPGAGGIGLRARDRGLSGFDVDESDPWMSAMLLAAFRQVLGPDIAVRWGNRPRFLIPFFLADGTVQGRTFTFPNGKKLQIVAGQFVAYGPHKDTGKPYEWENWDSDWPHLTMAQVQEVLAKVPALAGTSLRFSADHETCDPEELAEAVPRTEDEWQAGREAAQRYLGLLKQELMGRDENRGTTIFAIVGVLKFAALHGMCTRLEIEESIVGAGHELTEGRGGRTLGEEIDRQELMPVLRGNLVMGAIMNRRVIKHAFLDAQATPTLIARTGFELSLDDKGNEMPWLVHERILCGEVHFFTGHSGAGKSTVVTDAVHHILCGRPWLDGDIEKSDGHVLWIAAEDDYGTERRMRHLLRQEGDSFGLASRFHLVPSMPEPLAFERQCIAQIGAMTAMNKRVDAIILDTWGASGLCFADNDTEAVLKAMFILKLVAQRTLTAVIVTDHLPLGSADAWQKGNGAKSGGSAFVYRVTTDGNGSTSIDCGKTRGTPAIKSFTGKMVSEHYGIDRKGRPTTVNVFRRELVHRVEQKEVAATLKLAAMLPGATAVGMDALRAGSIVKFASVSGELGGKVADGEIPGYAVNKEAASEMFGDDGMKALTNSGHLRIMRGAPFFAIYAPSDNKKHALIVPWPVAAPNKENPR
jgi:hypothetical protein